MKVFPRLFSTRQFVWAVLATLAAGTVTGHANGGGYITGVVSSGAFKPFGLQQVEMRSEQLDIDLHIEHAEVRIEYVLHNPGPPVTVEAGFPSAVAADSIGTEQQVPKKDDLDRMVRLKGFELKADGSPVPITMRADDVKIRDGDFISSGGEGGGIALKGWHIFKLDFKKGQTRKISVKYSNPYFGTYGYVSDDTRLGPLTLTYLFSSAAAWSGPIKNGIVNVRAVSVDPSLVQFSHPNRFRRFEETWTWKFKDFEPTLEDDLVITTRPACFGQTFSTVDPVSGSEEWHEAKYMGWGAKIYSDDGNLGGKWELHRYDFTASATSSLPPDGDITYGANNLSGYYQRDSNGYAWVEGAKGDGIGESITLTLKKPAKLSRVGIVNGYAKSDDIYLKNNRVAKLEVSVDGSQPFQVRIPDEHLTREMFYFDLPESSKPVTSVKFTIAAVYKGSKYSDTAISELVLVSPLEKEPRIQGAR